MLKYLFPVALFVAAVAYSLPASAHPRNNVCDYPIISFICSLEAEKTPVQGRPVLPGHNHPGGPDSPTSSDPSGPSGPSGPGPGDPGGPSDPGPGPDTGKSNRSGHADGTNPGGQDNNSGRDNPGRGHGRGGKGK